MISDDYRLSLPGFCVNLLDKETFVHFLGSLFSSFSTFSQQCPVNSFFLAFCSIESTNLASFSSKTDLVCCCSAASGIGHRASAVFLYIIPAFGFHPFSNFTMYNTNAEGASFGTRSITPWPRGEQNELSRKVQFCHDIIRKGRQRPIHQVPNEPSGILPLFTLSHFPFILDWGEREKTRGGQMSRLHDINDDEDMGPKRGPWGASSDGDMF